MVFVVLVLVHEYSQCHCQIDGGFGGADHDCLAAVDPQLGADVFGIVFVCLSFC